MSLINNAYQEKNQAFIEEYKLRAGVKMLPCGVYYREIKKGKGEKPTPKSIITVNYSGKLVNGKCFDATQKGRPASFKLSQLINGWKMALKEMPIGARWEIVIPFNLGYGTRASGVIKPYSTLIFDVELLGFMQ